MFYGPRSSLLILCLSSSLPNFYLPLTTFMGQCSTFTLIVYSTVRLLSIFYATILPFPIFVGHCLLFPSVMPQSSPPHLLCHSPPLPIFYICCSPSFSICLSFLSFMSQSSSPYLLCHSPPLPIFYVTVLLSLSVMPQSSPPHLLCRSPPLLNFCATVLQQWLFKGRLGSEVASKIGNSR